MELALTVNCDNAAFDGDPAGEIAAILANLATRITEVPLDELRAGIKVRDSNGNTVGTATLVG